MRRCTIKKMFLMLFLWMIMITNSTLAVTSDPASHHQVLVHKKKLSRKLAKAFDLVTESNRLWRQQGGFFLPEIILVQEADAAVQTKLLTVLKEQTREVATLMGQFYTQTQSACHQAAHIAQLMIEFIQARQAYQQELLAQSDAQTTSFTNWSWVGHHLVQALAASNPKADVATLHEWMGELIREQASAIKSLYYQVFGTALRHVVQSVRYGIQMGTHLGRAILLQNQVIGKKTLDQTVMKSFGL